MTTNTEYMEWLATLSDETLVVVMTYFIDHLEREPTKDYFLWPLELQIIEGERRLAA